MDPASGMEKGVRLKKNRLVANFPLHLTHSNQTHSANARVAAKYSSFGVFILTSASDTHSSSTVSLSGFITSWTKYDTAACDSSTTTTAVWSRCDGWVCGWLCAYGGEAERPTRWRKTEGEGASTGVSWVVIVSEEML